VKGDAALAEQAARLCKADLVSATVGEFPEVQGIAGAYLARVAGLDPQVADAIRDHYKPVGQGDYVPTAPVSVAVALADKLDTLVGFFVIDEKPTGSRDPFALRRAALGILRILQEGQIRLRLFEAIDHTVAEQMLPRMEKLFLSEAPDDFSKDWGYSASYKPLPNGRYSLEINGEEIREIDEDDLGPYLAALISPGQRPIWRAALGDFLGDRLKVQQREAGIRHDLIDAVFELGEDDVIPLLERVRALQAFVATDDGANLLAGYKRAANILKIEMAKGDPGLAGAAVEPAEAALASALDEALPAASAAVRSEDFAGAMTALAGLRAPVDRFFADVMVNDPDPMVRAGRLALLARFRDAVHEVADFSRIEG
jgi:glycyl-tRNA synthetase beta chain